MEEFSIEELEPYLRPGFDPVEYSKLIVSDCSKRGSGATSLSESLAKLEKHQATVESTIAAHIAKHNEILRIRLSDSAKLRESICNIKANANALHASLNRVSQDILEPYDRMKSATAELEKLQEASITLRKFLRFLTAVRKLKSVIKHEGQSIETREDEMNLPESARDLAKCALVLYEVEELLLDKDLSEIQLVEEERAWVDLTGKVLRAKAKVVLERAIETLNQTEVGSGLQAFFNLRCLAECVEDSLKFAVSTLAVQVKQHLDIQSLAEDIRDFHEARANGSPQSIKPKIEIPSNLKRRSFFKPPKGQEEEWDSALWMRMEKIETAIRSWSLRVWNLERVLAKKRDPISRVVFAEIVEAYYLQQWKQIKLEDDAIVGERPQGAFQRYWVLATAELEVQYEKAVKAFPYVKTALGVKQYPKLRRLMRSLLFKLEQSTSGKSVPSVGGSGSEEQALLRSLRPFLEAFLARSLHRLNEPVNLMFPEKGITSISSTSSLPSIADITSFSKTIQEEVSLAGSDAELCMAICKGVSKAISFFCVKAEDAILFSKESTQFRLFSVNTFSSSKSGPGTKSLEAAAASAALRTQAQVHNITLLGLILRLHDFTSNLSITTFTEDTANDGGSHLQMARAMEESLSPAISSLKALIELILGQYLSAAAEALGTILGRIHRENFTSSISSSFTESQNDVETISSYMQAFKGAVVLFKREHLDKLPVSFAIVRDIIELFQARIIVLYVRHVSMVRPLDSSGRQQLIFDMNEFDTIMEKINENSMCNLGIPYEEFRGMKKLLEIDPKSIPDTLVAYRELLDEVRLSTLLNYLFSTAPAELQSPYDQLKMSPERFSEWMDKAESGNLKHGIELLNTGTTKTKQLENAILNLVRRELDLYMQRKSVGEKSLEHKGRDEDTLAEEYHIIMGLTSV